MDRIHRGLPFSFLPMNCMRWVVFIERFDCMDSFFSTSRDSTISSTASSESRPVCTVAKKIQVLSVRTRLSTAMPKTNLIASLKRWPLCAPYWFFGVQRRNVRRRVEGCSRMKGTSIIKEADDDKRTRAASSGTYMLETKRFCC